MGKIGKTYGILGWMKIFSFTENQEKIFDYKPWFILKEKKMEKIQPKAWKNYKNNFIFCVKNISDPSEAKKLTNLNIFINRNILPKLPHDEYYWNDIISCNVFDTQKKYLGKVINLIRTQYNDIIVIEHLSKKKYKKIIIPFIDQKIIQNVNIKKKTIIVNWNENKQ